MKDGRKITVELTESGDFGIKFEGEWFGWELMGIAATLHIFGKREEVRKIEEIESFLEELPNVSQS